MRLLRKLLSLTVYAALLLPIGDSIHFNAWMRAIELTSTAFDSTMRRRKSRLENDRFSRHLRLLQRDSEYEERTLRVRLR